MLWPVFYASWEMECCGTPFSIGDHVTWPLQISYTSEPWLPDSELVEADIHPEVIDGVPIVRIGSLVATMNDADSTRRQSDASASTPTITEPCHPRFL